MAVEWNSHSNRAGTTILYTASNPASMIKAIINCAVDLICRTEHIAGPRIDALHGMLVRWLGQSSSIFAAILARSFWLPDSPRSSVSRVGEVPRPLCSAGGQGGRLPPHLLPGSCRQGQGAHEAVSLGRAVAHAEDNLRPGMTVLAYA